MALLRKFLLLFILSIPSNSWGAIAKVASVYADSNDTFTTGSIDTTGATLITAGVGFELTIPALTDSKGNTWAENKSVASGGNANCKMFSSFNPVVGSGHTFTLTGITMLAGIGAIAWSGAGDFSDATGASQGFNTTVQPGSLTPSADNMVLVSVSEGNPGGSTSADAPFNTNDGVFNKDDFQGTTGAQSFEIQTTATARNPTWTYGSNATLTAILASYSPAAAAAAGPQQRIRARPLFR